MIRENARQFLEAEAPLSWVHAGLEAGYDGALWDQMVELGWPALTISEEHGGLGLGMGEQSVLFEEMGRLLTPSPLLISAVVSAAIVERLEEGAMRSELLEALAAGTIMSFASIKESSDSPTIEAVALNGMEAQRFLFPIGSRVAIVDAVDVERNPIPPLDLTRPMASVAIDAAQLESGVVGEIQDGAVADAFNRGRIALANEMVGVAAACLNMTGEYAKQRYQFGRPIGSFQAIKHKMADVFFALETARSMARAASKAADTDPERVALMAPAAKELAAQAAFLAASEMIQIHAGIGFTWEHDAHLYFKRAESVRMMWGTSEQNRDAVAAELAL